MDNTRAQIAAYAMYYLKVYDAFKDAAYELYDAYQIAMDIANGYTTQEIERIVKDDDLRADEVGCRVLEWMEARRKGPKNYDVTLTCKLLYERTVEVKGAASPEQAQEMAEAEENETMDVATANWLGHEIVNAKVVPVNNET